MPSLGRERKYTALLFWYSMTNDPDAARNEPETRFFSDHNCVNAESMTYKSFTCVHGLSHAQDGYLACPKHSNNIILRIPNQ